MSIIVGTGGGGGASCLLVSTQQVSIVTGGGAGAQTSISHQRGSECHHCPALSLLSSAIIVNHPFYVMNNNQSPSHLSRTLCFSTL